MRLRLAVNSCSATSSLCLARLQCVMVCAPIVTSGSSAKDFSSSQDMQSSRAIAASSTPWRSHSADISRRTSCSPGRARSQSCNRSKAACLADGEAASRRIALPPISTSIEAALAITRSSVTHHNRPVPSAKSLATYTVQGASNSRKTGNAKSRLSR